MASSALGALAENVKAALAGDAGSGLGFLAAGAWPGFGGAAPPSRFVPIIYHIVILYLILYYMLYNIYCYKILFLRQHKLLHQTPFVKNVHKSKDRNPKKRTQKQKQPFQ